MDETTRVKIYKRPTRVDRSDFKNENEPLPIKREIKPENTPVVESEPVRYNEEKRFVDAEISNRKVKMTRNSAFLLDMMSVEE